MIVFFPYIYLKELQLLRYPLRQWPEVMPTVTMVTHMAHLVIQLQNHGDHPRRLALT